MLNQKIIVYILVLLLSGINRSFCQSSHFDKKGIIVFNRPKFKHFAILMQDTTLSGNRFDNWFDIQHNNKVSINPQATIKHPAFIVDSCLFETCEKKLLHPDSSIAFYNYSNNHLKENITKYIRLYIGYIDSDGNRKVVIQFLKPKEFKKKKYIYNKELFLVANQKKLRFAVIRIIFTEPINFNRLKRWRR